MVWSLQTRDVWSFISDDQSKVIINTMTDYGWGGFYGARMIGSENILSRDDRTSQG